MISKKESQDKRNYGLPNIQYMSVTVLSVFTSISSVISKPKPEQSPPKPQNKLHTKRAQYPHWSNGKMKVTEFAYLP